MLLSKDAIADVVEILKGHDAWSDLITRLCHPGAPGDPVLRHRDAYAL